MLQVSMACVCATPQTYSPPILETDLCSKHLKQTSGHVELTGASSIAIDEFGIQVGHRYATVIVEPSRKRVLCVGRGRSRADIRPVFEPLGQEGCERIQAVAMGMNSAFDLEVKARCPNIEMVYDPFQVVANYGR